MVFWSKSKGFFGQNQKVFWSKSKGFLVFRLESKGYWVKIKGILVKI